MPFLLLVEGSDDHHLIRNVAREHGLDVDSERRPHLPVAVVVDADRDLAARWDAVAYQLTAAGYDAPKSPPLDGLVVTNRRPVVGIWLMPDNSLPGALEDFATHLIPPHDPLWPRAVSTVGDIPADERRFTSDRKAEIHTYLAWQEEPGTPLGLAVTKRYFQTDSDLCRRFVDWLRQLRETV